MGKNKRKKKRNKKTITHEEAVKELEEKVKENYQIILKNATYYIPDSKDTIGEFDLIGISSEEIHIYEVKSNEENYKQAVEQLQRAREKLSERNNIRTFYYSGKTKELVEVFFDSNQTSIKK